MEEHSRGGAATPTSNVLLSVEEILGLVIDDDDDDHDDDPIMSPSPVSVFLRSDSLGTPSPCVFPPVPKRAQTWHAMSGSCSNPFHRSKIETNRDYRTANAAAEDDDTMEIDEVSQDGSMTTNAPESPFIPHRQFQHHKRALPPSTTSRRPSRGRTLSPDATTTTTTAATDPLSSRMKPSLPNHQQQQQHRPNIVESRIAPFETNRDSERNEHLSKKTVTSSWPPPYHHHHRPIYPSVTTTTTNNKTKKPTSRFEIFENKLREEEGTFGIML